MVARSTLAVSAATMALVAGLSACAAPPLLPPGSTYGSTPQITEPHKSLFIPTVNIATAVGWPQGRMPTPAAGFRVQAFASGLDHPRWLYRLPNGDVLVAQTNAPPNPLKKTEGIRGWVMGLVMKKAGATPPSANTILLLRDADGDGVAETRTTFLTGLTSPFGMALVRDRLFVANADAVMAFPYQTGATQITAAGTKLVDLPAQRNHHWTKSLVASADGTKLYVGVGSNSNIGENGMEEETGRAAIHEIDIATGQSRIYASGLRNPVGMAWQPDSGKLWVAVNERDELGNDLVPDYMTSITPGAFYGWPYSYYGQHVDTRVQPQDPAKVASAIPPDYALGAHTASLGLTFYEGSLFPATFSRGAFVGQHGSWNREPRSGYKVIFVPFTNGVPSGAPMDVLTGFLNDEGEAMGRPVGVQTDRTGALLVADDVGNVIWRVSPST